MFLRGEIHRVSGSTAIRSMVVSRTGPFRIATCSSRKRPPYLTRGASPTRAASSFPVEIELTLKKAELLAFVETSDRPREYYVGRDLRRVFRLAGLVRCTVWSVAFTRQAPLDPATRSFLEGYLENLRRRTGRLTSSPACESSSNWLCRPWFEPVRTLRLRPLRDVR